MAVLRPATTVAIAVTVWCLLAHAVDAFPGRHCRYTAAYFGNSPVSDTDKAGSFCRRNWEGLLFQTCCSEDHEKLLWNSTIDSYNQALRTLAHTKLDSVGAYLRYLIDEHALDLADKVQLIPHLLTTTGNYEKSGDFWNDAINYKVDAMFKRLARSNVTLQELSLGMMEHAETIIRYLIEQLILRRTATQPEVLELMRTVLYEWISQKEDAIVYSLFQEKEIIGQRFILTLVRFNRLTLVLRNMEKFWQVVLQKSAFPARAGPLGLEATDSMTQCLLNFMNLTKCQLCYLATKDYHICPHIFLNQTTCLTTLLQTTEKEYAALMSYYRAIFLEYNLLYADAAHQFSIRHLINIKKLVNQRWLDIVNVSINQYASRRNFTRNQEAQARAYLNSLSSKTFNLFTKDELTEPESIPVNKQFNNPIISRTAKFADTPGQFSILSPLHELLLQEFSKSASLHNANNSTTTTCWNGRDASGAVLQTPTFTDVKHSAEWTTVIQELNVTATCVICLVSHIPIECKMCAETLSISEYTTEPITTTQMPRSAKLKTGKRLRTSTTTAAFTTATTTAATTGEYTTTTTTTTTATTATTTTTTTTTTHQPSTSASVVQEDYYSPYFTINDDDDNDTVTFGDDAVTGDPNIPDDEDITMDASGKDYQDTTRDDLKQATAIIIVNQTTPSSTETESGSTSTSTTAATNSTSRTTARQSIVLSNDKVKTRSHESQSIKSGSEAICSFSIFSVLLAYTVTSLYAYALRFR